MDNKDVLLEEYRRQLQELNQKIDALSQESKTPPKPVEQPRSDIPQWQQRYRVPGYNPPPVANNAPRQTAPSRKLSENQIGSNLFAILASALILAGISIFIASIYEYIPTALKVVFIFALGGGMLAGGLALYSRKQDGFWLGVAGCGLAELLLSIIACYSHFRILPLGAAFVLILGWTLCSLWLTKYQNVVFKSIGYLGLVISMFLGMSQIGPLDLGMNLALFGTYAALSTFFMVTTPRCSTINTVISFCNLAQLCMFTGMDRLMPEGFGWVSVLLGLMAMAVYHSVYVCRTGLVDEAYPYFSMASSLVLFIFCIEQNIRFVAPVMLFTSFAMWFGCLKHGKSRWGYTTFSGVVLGMVAVAGSITEAPVWLWFALFTVGAYVLYRLTRQQDIPFLGLGLFLFTLLQLPVWDIPETLLCLAAAVGFFALTGSSLLPKNAALQSLWYVVALLISTRLVSLTIGLLSSDAAAEAMICAYLLVLAVLNTAYLHISLPKKAAELGLCPVLLMVIQGFLLMACLDFVESRYWFCVVGGILSSLLILSYSLHYLLANRLMTKNLLTWQFVKFSLYTMVVLGILGAATIVGQILLLVISIFAIQVGIRLDIKAVRVYGLILSLLDVASLVLLNIDYGSSIELSLGIIACGILCFGISFIYFRAAKSTEKDKNDPE